MAYRRDVWRSKVFVPISAVAFGGGLVSEYAIAWLGAPTLAKSHMVWTLFAAAFQGGCYVLVWSVIVLTLVDSGKWRATICGGALPVLSPISLLGAQFGVLMQFMVLMYWYVYLPAGMCIGWITAYLLSRHR